MICDEWLCCDSPSSGAIGESGACDQINAFSGPLVRSWPLPNSDLTVEGVVREISPVADPATRTYTVKVTLENPPQQFRFGMGIGGRLKERAALAVALPLSALFDNDGSPAVCVLDQA